MNKYPFTYITLESRFSYIFFEEVFNGVINKTKKAEIKSLPSR
jgi:hypothetical protein